MTQAIQVLTTTTTKDDAQRIARDLVELRLAGCVQVYGPITSTYWWQGEVQSQDEYLCVAKTTTERYESIEAAIKRLHPYDLPEIVAVAITAGSADYLSWLRRETGSGEA